MKKIIYSLLSILLCGLQSCVDLDMAPYNQVASGNMWSNAALTNQEWPVFMQNAWMGCLFHFL